MNIKFQVKYGTSSEFELLKKYVLEGRAKFIQGCWYLLIDTQELYVSFDGVTITLINGAGSIAGDADYSELLNRVSSSEQKIISHETRIGSIETKLGDLQPVFIKSQSELPKVGKEGQVYIIQGNLNDSKGYAEGTSFIWKDYWVRTTPDVAEKVHEAIKVIYGGNATIDVINDDKV